MGVHGASETVVMLEYVTLSRCSQYQMAQTCLITASNPNCVPVHCLTGIAGMSNVARSTRSMNGAVLVHERAMSGESSVHCRGVLQQ